MPATKLSIHSQSTLDRIAQMCRIASKIQDGAGSALTDVTIYRALIDQFDLPVASEIMHEIHRTGAYPTSEGAVVALWRTVKH